MNEDNNRLRLRSRLERNRRPGRPTWPGWVAVVMVACLATGYLVAMLRPSGSAKPAEQGVAAPASQPASTPAGSVQANPQPAQQPQVPAVVSNQPPAQAAPAAGNSTTPAPGPGADQHVAAPQPIQPSTAPVTTSNAPDPVTNGGPVTNPNPWSVYEPITQPGSPNTVYTPPIELQWCTPLTGRLTAAGDRISVIVGIPSADGQRAVTADAIIDTGAANTIFPDAWLRGGGYAPISEPFEVGGIGSVPAVAYWYRIPFPSLWNGQEWRPLDRGYLDVIGVVNATMKEPLIAPGALKSSSLTVTGRDWTLITPCYQQ